MPIITSTPAVDRAIATARGLPSLIANLSAINPMLARQLESKPLLASKSVWGTPIATGIAWVSTRYGLGFDDNTCALLSGLVTLGAAAAFRAMTRQPIAGVVNTPAGVPPAVPSVGPTVPPVGL